MTRIYVIAALAAFILIGGLGLTLRIKTLEAAAIKVELAREQENRRVLDLQIKTDAAVKAADDDRAVKNEAELKALKDRHDVEIKGLKNPTRQCFDADDTQRLQRILRR